MMHETWPFIGASPFLVLQSESLSSKCTMLHTVATSNNRDHPTR